MNIYRYFYLKIILCEKSWYWDYIKYFIDYFWYFKKLEKYFGKLVLYYVVIKKLLCCFY